MWGDRTCQTSARILLGQARFKQRASDLKFCNRDVAPGRNLLVVDVGTPHDVTQACFSGHFQGVADR